MVETSAALGLGDDPKYSMVLQSQIEYYNKVGFNPPWIGYLALSHSNVVGVCSFKGSPTKDKVEIGYFTFPEHERNGYGTLMCAGLVEIALATDPKVIVTARTLPQHNPSTAILNKNGFVRQGTVLDDEDGEVWEWVFVK